MTKNPFRLSLFTVFIAPLLVSTFLACGSEKSLNEEEKDYSAIMAEAPVVSRSSIYGEFSNCSAPVMHDGGITVWYNHCTNKYFITVD